MLDVRRQQFVQLDTFASHNLANQLRWESAKNRGQQRRAGGELELEGMTQRSITLNEEHMLWLNIWATTSVQVWSELSGTFGQRKEQQMLAYLIIIVLQLRQEGHKARPEAREAEACKPKF